MVKPVFYPGLSFGLGGGLHMYVRGGQLGNLRGMKFRKGDLSLHYTFL